MAAVVTVSSAANSARRPAILPSEARLDAKSEITVPDTRRTSLSLRSVLDIPASAAKSPTQGDGVTSDDDTAQGLWYVGPGRAEIREERLPPIADSQVRVRALYGA